MITRYTFDGPDIVTEYDGAGVVVSGYVHALSIDDPLSVTPLGQNFYFHKDSLGSITDLTDSSGAAVQSYNYDSYGNITAAAGTLIQPFTFTGREFDPETGLYFYRERYYDAGAGRFITRDPLSFAAGDVNVYRYVGNSPLNWVDPWGLISEDDLTYLYQKVSKTGQHLKYGITKDPATRYTAKELAGGNLVILAKGERKDMLTMERELHRTFPLGPEEKQCQYIKLQKQRSLNGIGRVMGVLGVLSTILDVYEASQIAEVTRKSVWQVQLERMGYSFNGGAL